MYKFHTPSGDNSCDGMAMALRAGLALRDMEMVQFHPTGLLAGPETRMTGTVLEEGLRGAGGYLLGGDGKGFMEKYDPRLERATRDIVSRAMMAEIRRGNTTPDGGLWIDMRHLGAANVRKLFKGMVQRCADCGFDLAGGLVEVIPTAHYMMGGVVFRPDCATALPGLFAAGEDTGGVRGGTRLGGNGVANSTVFGGIAGDSMAAWVPEHGRFHPPDKGEIEAAVARCRRPLGQAPGDVAALREALYELMWEDAGIFRDAAGLRRAADALDELERRLSRTGIAGGTLAFNLTWHDWLNLDSLILTSRAIVAAALAREESRGAHFRSDFPETRPNDALSFTTVRLADSRIAIDWEPVRFTRVKPGESLLPAEAAQ
jgi:fumarate reductase flavoprotein subunit